MEEFKKKSLDVFINQINRDYKWDKEGYYLNYDIDGFSFLRFYEAIILRGNNVIDEIKENLLLMKSDKHTFYLNYVKDRITRDVVSNVDDSFLNKWIEKFKVSGLDFPFTDDPTLKEILSKAIDYYKEELPVSYKLTTEIQKDFYLYTYYLTKKRIIDFIENIKNDDFVNYENSDGTQVDTKTADNPYPRIFTSNKAFLIFEKLKNEFGNTSKNLSNYSYVYHKMTKDDLIFNSISQLEYFDLLAIYDIHINRIKGIDDLGNTQFRDSIYASVK